MRPLSPVRSMEGCVVFFPLPLVSGLVPHTGLLVVCGSDGLPTEVWEGPYTGLWSMGRIWITGRKGRTPGWKWFEHKNTAADAEMDMYAAGRCPAGDRSAFVCVYVEGVYASLCVFAWRGMEDGRGVVVVGKEGS